MLKINEIIKQSNKHNALLTKLKGVSSNTRFNYLLSIRQIEKFTGNDIRNLNSNDIQDFLLSLEKKGFKNATINAKRFALQSIYNQMVLDNIVNENPVKKLASYTKITKKQDVKSRVRLTLPEIKAAISKGDKSSLLIAFLSTIGIRVSEMANIRLVNIKEMISHFEIKIIRGKDGYSWTTYINDFDLMNNIIKTFNGNTYLFETNTGKKYHRNACYRMIHLKFKAIGRLDVTPHSLRHFYVTTMVEKGYSAKAISKLLGITPSILTKYYDHSEIPLQNRCLNIF
jgi:integrase/recombinase XerD